MTLYTYNLIITRTRTITEEAHITIEQEDKMTPEALEQQAEELAQKENHQSNGMLKWEIIDEIEEYNDYELQPGSSATTDEENDREFDY